MKRSLFSCLLTLLCAVTTFGAQAADAAKATPKGDAARGQTIVSTVCVACHGPDGNSPLAVNPKLAGQHADYLVKQMKNFKPRMQLKPQWKKPTNRRCLKNLRVRCWQKNAIYWGKILVATIRHGLEIPL